MSLIIRISYAVDWGEELIINDKTISNQECKELLDAYSSLDKEEKEIFKQLDDGTNHYMVILTLKLISKMNDHLEK